MNERYTFIDIYQKELDLNKDTKVKVSQVIIPKIQRPYAQGRLDGVCTYVRNTLLNEMFANFKTEDIFDGKHGDIMYDLFSRSPFISPPDFLRWRIGSDPIRVIFFGCLECLHKLIILKIAYFRVVKIIISLHVMIYRFTKLQIFIIIHFFSS